MNGKSDIQTVLNVNFERRLFIMKKTRIFALILALAAAVTMFAGCGGEKESSVYSEYSMPSMPATSSIPKAVKWTAEVSEVDGWTFANIPDRIFYCNESIDIDCIAFMQYDGKLSEGETLNDVIQAFIDDCKTNPLYNNHEWIIETPKKTTFGGKESYEIVVNYAVQVRAARRYRLIFTQLDDEVFIFNNNYTIRLDARDETLIDNLMNAVTFVPMA